MNADRSHAKLAGQVEDGHIEATDDAGLSIAWRPRRPKAWRRWFDAMRWRRIN